MWKLRSCQQGEATLLLCGRAPASCLAKKEHACNHLQRPGGKRTNSAVRVLVALTALHQLMCCQESTSRQSTFFNTSFDNRVDIFSEAPSFYACDTGVEVHLRVSTGDASIAFAADQTGSSSKKEEATEKERQLAD